MNQSYQSGEINETELSLMQNIFSFDQRVVKDIMLPRTQVVFLDNNMENDEVLNIIDKITLLAILLLQMAIRMMYWSFKCKRNGNKYCIRTTYHT